MHNGHAEAAVFRTTVTPRRLSAAQRGGSVGAMIGGCGRGVDYPLVTVHWHFQHFRVNQFVTSTSEFRFSTSTGRVGIESRTTIAMSVSVVFRSARRHSRVPIGITFYDVIDPIVNLEEE
ncbi:unnamed protein product [Nesidiocoris tenuis]|uniref:Uncharacterized protein n=1 Tax=Nesidiocoris tenuis TaxID=355587 RepID=A0A6H5G718_9HEMI|nr:unnamed protein product [Nesidiocoris tenuis]